MKKLLSILVAVLALCLVFSIAMADDDSDSRFKGEEFEEVMRTHQIDGHTVGDYTVEREPSCTQKGILRFACETDNTHFHEVYTDMLDHDFVGKDDCTVGKTCKNCGKKVPGDHIWSSEWNNWSDAEKAKYKPYDYDLSSLNNDKFFWGRVTVEPTCTSAGEAIDFCPRCGATRDVTRVIEPLPHMYEDLVTIHDPNCLDGEDYWEYGWQCVGCGEWLLDADGEIYTKIGTVEDYANEYGLDYNDVNEWLHAWDAWFVTKAPTCYEEGKKVRLCPRCGDKQELPIDKLEPEYVELDSRLIDCYNEEKTFVCANCGSKAPNHESFTVSRPVVAHQYIQDKKYLKEEVKPGCETDGKLVYYCIHDPDCTTHTGHDNVKHDDDSYLVVTVPALGHDWSKWELRYSDHYNGQDNENSYWLRECNRCHTTEERVSEYAPEDACEEHKYEYIETIDPICAFEEDGYDVNRCTVCGHYDYTQNIVPFAHTWETITVPASYEASGKTIKVCTVCGKQVEEEIKPVDPTKVEAFVRRLYDTVLDRDGGVAEVKQYADALVAGEKTAAEVVSDFINSEEFGKKEDADTIEALYNTMLDRESDVAGYVDWYNLATYGVSNNKLINGFAGSQEFEELCKEYDIKPGKLEEETRDRNVSVTGFVNRCYREALNRDGEADGLNYWTGKLLTAELTPQQVGFGFVFSDEFDAEDRIAGGEAADVVWSLYGLYLDRAPSAGEVDWYVAQLESGDMTLEQLNYSFAESDEFKNIILTYNMYAVAE